MFNLLRTEKEGKRAELAEVLSQTQTITA